MKYLVSILTAVVLAVTTLCLILWACDLLGMAEVESVRFTESRVVRQINRARHQEGLPWLQTGRCLNRYAQRHTREMAAAGEIYHSTKRQLSRLATRCKPAWRVVGENVGSGSTLRSIHKAFMSSELHRVNILGSQYRRLGVGVCHRGERYWVTQIFLG